MGSVITCTFIRTSIIPSLTLAVFFTLIVAFSNCNIIVKAEIKIKYTNESESCKWKRNYARICFLRENWCLPLMEWCSFVQKVRFWYCKGVYTQKVSKVHKRVNTWNVELAFLTVLSICNCYLKEFKGEWLQNYTNKSYGSCALHVV